jgi:type I restriction enzyme S subunit
MKYKLSEICSGITDGSHNPPTGVGYSEYLMLSSKNVFDDEITYEEPRYLSEEQFATEHKRTEIKYNDVLMTIVGTIGRTAIVTDNMPPITLQRSVAVLHPIENICLSRYLMYELRSKRRYFESEAHGVAQKGIYLKQLSNIIVDIPDKQCQIDRAQILDQIQSIIKKRSKEISKLDDLIKARFVELFGDPRLNPNGYPVHQLSDFIEFLTSGSRGWAQYCVADGTEWFITIKNVKDCRISIDNMQPINAPNNAEARRTRVQEGDLLISITADLGRTGVVTKEIADHGAYINQHLTCIRLNRDVLEPLYVAYFMESSAGKEQFMSKNQSAVKAGLNFNSINTLRLLIPPKTVQQEFLTFVAQVDKSKLQKKISKR